MFWDNLRDANMRLSDSIVRHGTLPVLIHEIDEQNEVIARRLEDEEIFRFPYARETVNTLPVSLGYTRCRGGVGYLQRTPGRRYKQGLVLNRMMVTGNDRSRPVGAVGTPSLRDLYKTITNQYVSFEEALQAATEGDNTAFHRRWLLRNRDGRILVEYKGFSAGFVEGGEIILSDRMSYLSEALQEVLP